MSRIARLYPITVPQAHLDRIRTQLELADTGYAPDDDDHWEFGTDASYLRALRDYWLHSYDWRVAERRLNGFTHYETMIEGLAVRYYHVRGDGSRITVILSHGWPGSVLEFLDVIAPLHEAGHDVVVPSLPGFGFSQRPLRPISAADIARMWNILMTDRLSYAHYAAHGTDWGALITIEMARNHPERLAAIHVNTLAPPPDWVKSDATIAAYREALSQVRATETGYIIVQKTKPQTIGLALTASPLAFAAWVVEKFHRWGDVDGDIESRFDKDTIITNLMIYLVNDAVQSGIWLYRSLTDVSEKAWPIGVPTGVAVFPGDYMPPPPRSAAEQMFAIARWTDMQEGGHFPGLEVPTALAADLIQFLQEYH